MAYFTTVLQHQVNNVWRKKIEDAYADMRLHSSGKAIRDYLNNRQTLCTAGFVIRRYLQNEMPELLEQVKARTGSDYADLSNNLNVKWPPVFIDELARELYRISKDKGISISRTTWISYLDDAPIKMYKNTPFKVAFALSMNIEATEELLMACGQDTYCFRNPEHFIFYYCQNRSVFSWQHALDLINKYKSGIGNETYTANDASSGMTHVLRSDLKHIFGGSGTDPETDEALIEYMIANQKEFSGLSLTARNDFLRMAQYLAILYPAYSKVTSAKDPKSGEILEITEDVPIGKLPDGTPKLSELVRALFSTGGWLPTTVDRYVYREDGKKERTASSIRRRQNADSIEYKRAETDELKDKPFLNSVQYFVDSYSHHVDAIDRVFRRPQSPDNVERRDVILFTYFFIRRYPELLANEDMYGKELDDLTSLVYDDGRIDICMDHLMDELYCITMNQLENENNDDFDKSSNTIDYIDLFNEVLKSFGMKGMYMPNPWDRFITMSLFAEDPDYFTEAVLWNTISDDEGDASENDPEEEEPAMEDEADTENLSMPAHRDPVTVQVKYPSATPSTTGPDGRKVFLNASLLRSSTGETIPVNKSCFVFGRLGVQSAALQNYGFRTETLSISRYHAAILFQNNTFYLSDISKGVCTWLNDHKLNAGRFEPSVTRPVFTANAYPLKHNDRIRLVNEEFVFLLS